MVTVDFSNLGTMLNPWVKRIWNNRDRYVVAKGGGGSGKSYGIAQLLVYRIIAEPGHKLLVVRKVANTLRDSCFALIKEVIHSYGCEGLFKINKTDMTIECTNGSIILFKGLDDPEKIKSIQGIDLMWIEESSELLVEDYRQLSIRLRSKSKYPLQMFLSFNPISMLHWLKSEFFDRPKDDAILIETTYKDNRFLVPEAVKVLEDFKETDEYYYMVYCLGHWGITGSTVFPAKLVAERLNHLRDLYKVKPPKKGYFIYEKEAYVDEAGNPGIKILDDTIEFIEDPNSYISIYEDVEDYMPYVLGGDTAGEGSDYFIGQVIDNTNGNQVATLRVQKMDEDKYAEQMYCLGIYYNTALISVEVNFSTYPQKCLEKLNYPNLYLRQTEDVIGDLVQNKYGFKT